MAMIMREMRCPLSVVRCPFPTPPRRAQTDNGERTTDNGSACRAGRARRRVARRGLTGGQRLTALDPQVALGDAVVDEVPRQHFGVVVCAVDIAVGMGQVVETIALPCTD